MAGLPDALAEARDLLAHAGGVGLAGGGAARLHPQPRPPRAAWTPREGRDGAAADVPPAHPDPHPQREREVPERDLAPEPALDPHRATRQRLGIATGDLVRVTTEIGYFVNRAWVTESIAPGVVACSHHLGRWRLHEGEGSRWSSPRVVDHAPGRGPAAPAAAGGPGPVRERRPRLQPHLVERRRRPPEPDLPGPSRPGLGHALLAPEGRGGPRARRKTATATSSSDTARSMEVYREWLAKARPGPGPAGCAGPLWLDRPLRPAEEMFRV